MNTLSYVSCDCVRRERLVDRVSSAFLAVKHASLAMMKANPERGKPYGGGSIVLVASGEPSFFPLESHFLTGISHSVAGLRSGAGPLDCERFVPFGNL